MAKEILETGLKPYDVFSKIYEQRTISQVKLMGSVIDSLEIFDEFASIKISSKMMYDCQAKLEDVDGFTDFARSIKGVEVSFMISELSDNKFRINFRSRGKYIINDIAEHYGGGGHKFAAGATVNGSSFTEIELNILEMLKEKKGIFMSIKSDKWIRKMSLSEKMISPFTDNQIRKGTISYGLSSYGYDIRVFDEYKIFTNVNNSIVDPKKFDENSFVDFKGDICIVPPNSFALARSIEYFKIPRNVLTVCLGKSTYARCGIIVNVTPFEPEWEGHVTLEISNTTPLPAKIYSNEGLCQVLFFESDEQCEKSYLDKKGKYQNQTGITLPKNK